MKLDSFENEISSTILQRGLSYFKNGQVSDLEEIEKGYYMAMVEGTDEYDVEIKIKRNTIVEADCTCPYEDGICKHIVAVLYEIRKESESTKIIEVKEVKKKGTVKKETSTKKETNIKSLLEKLESEELKKFIVQYASKNVDFKNTLLIQFAEKDESIDIYSKYREIIQKCLKDNSKKSRGFVNIKFGRLRQNINTMAFSKAKEAYGKNNLKEAFLITKATVDELAVILKNHKNYTYEGQLDELVESCFKTLEKLYGEKRMAPAFRDEVYEYMMQSSILTNNLFSNLYDLENIFNILLNTSKNENPEDALKLIGKIKDSYQNTSDEYHIVQFIKMEIGYLESLNRSKDVDELIKNNLKYTQIKQLFVDSLIKNKKFEEAKICLKEAIKNYNKRGHLGELSMWESKLLEIAILEKDINTIKTIARKKAFENYRINKEKYLLLKSYYTEVEWSKEVETLIKKEKEIIEKERQSWGGMKASYTANLIFIYEVEKKYDELIKLNLKANEWELFTYCLPFLKSLYSEEMIQVAYATLVKSAANLQDTNSYSNLSYRILKVASELKEMKPTLTKLILGLKEKYPNRPSLIKIMDETLKQL